MNCRPRNYERREHKNARKQPFDSFAHDCTIEKVSRRISGDDMSGKQRDARFSAQRSACRRAIQFHWIHGAALARAHRRIARPLVATHAIVDVACVAAPVAARKRNASSVGPLARQQRGYAHDNDSHGSKAHPTRVHVILLLQKVLEISGLAIHTLNSRQRASMCT
jgi:hypothetical protein